LQAEEELQDAMNHLSDVTRSENETQTLNTKLAQENARLQTDVEELNLALENVNFVVVTHFVCVFFLTYYNVLALQGTQALSANA